MSDPKYTEVCQETGCEEEVFVDDFGVTVCQKHLTPEIETYLARQQRREDARL